MRLNHDIVAHDRAVEDHRAVADHDIVAERAGMHDGVLADAHPVPDDRRIDVMRDVHGRARPKPEIVADSARNGRRRGSPRMRRAAHCVPIVARPRTAARWPAMGAPANCGNVPRIWKHEQRRGMTRYRDTRRLVELVAGHFALSQDC